MELLLECDGRWALIPELLKEWDKMLHDLEAIMRTWTLPYIYRERPNLGILAAAAARIGYLPFEEYSADKGGTKDRWTGRADLWLARRDGTRAFDFEAKYVKVSFRSKRLAKTVQHHLDVAARDAYNITYKSEHTIGIVFVCPYGATPTDLSPNRFWGQLNDLGRYSGDFCAFHLCSPKIWSQERRSDHPGIAIVGRYV